MTTLIRNPFAATRRNHGLDSWGLMRDLMSWDPFREVDAATTRVGAFSPAFEVRETPESWIIKADLPGVEEKALEITLLENRLTVSGSREAEERKDTDTYLSTERLFGSFSRSFLLPEEADVEAAEAKLHGGVLTLTIPKRPAVQPRKLSVSVTADEKGQAEG